MWSMEPASPEMHSLMPHLDPLSQAPRLKKMPPMGLLHQAQETLPRVHPAPALPL